ncbi:HNH endonuclease signature motif containing protein [Agromyces humatus]|uniref:HNH nuclease domain-containing protein n=1 Tax=Agromyces humatus TaxID=279573 RepID=A0ABP4X238_9MICO|nr:HNH endonuclease signature motif containing protein [Agromyces humatus]
MAETFDNAGAGLLDPLAGVDLTAFFESEAAVGPEGAADSDATSFDVSPFESDAWFEFSEASAPADAFAELCSALDAAESAQFEVNWAMAAHLDAVARALALAARQPGLYLRGHACAGSDAAELAVRAAAAELSMRLQVPAGTIRTRAHEATVLQTRLPGVWARFVDGVAGYVDARVAVDAAAGFGAGDARLAELDDALSSVIGTVSTARFRQRARTVRAGLERDRLEVRHTRAFAQRRVVVEHVDDGMAWVSLYTSQVDAARVWARLDATARRDVGAADEPRNLDQLRADAAVAWLAGDGTPSAARAEVIVTVPVLSIAGVDTAPGMLDGVGPIDVATARQLFADAPSFLRLAVDPITAAPLALDRTRYRPTKAQRLWLTLTHGRCTRPGCDRLAISADIDHQIDWQHGGATNADNLSPACRGDHRLKHASQFTHTKNRDDTVTWLSPTGRAYTDPPPF